MEPTEPSFIEKTKNFANFSWDIINYINKNGANSLVVSDETYKIRHEICKSCEMWIKKKDICAECGCFIPAKARVVLESCPLDKWSQDKEGWEEALKRLSEKIDKDN